MKIFGDWVVKNEEERIEASLRSVLPYIDEAVVIDTGSTDRTLEIVEAVKKDFSNLVNIIKMDIGPHFNMSMARNTGLSACPAEFDWYMETAGDEVYDDTIKNLRPTLENLPVQYVWVYTWGRDWHIHENTGEKYIKNHKFGRPRLYRRLSGMAWEGVWNRERVLYPGLGSYFPYEHRNDRHHLYWDANVWYDHYGWADNKRHYRNQVYTELNMLERKGVLPHPRA